MNRPYLTSFEQQHQITQLKRELAKKDEIIRQLMEERQYDAPLVRGAGGAHSEERE